MRRWLFGGSAAVLPLLAALLLPSAFPLDWPLAAVVVTGTFGEDRGDHFHDGIDLGGGGQEVRVVLPGELVFRYDEGSDYTSLPRGTGSTVALLHDQNIITLYCHLASGSLGPVRTKYATTDRVGIVGSTGHADGEHLHFAVYDAEARSYVNPLAFLPPLRDSQAPVIRRILLATGDQRRPLDNGAVVPPGKAEVLAEVYDLREDVRFSWPLAPYSVALTLDGTQVSKIAFDSLRVEEGRTVAAGTARQDVYASDGFMRLGTVELRVGDSRLRIVARDYAQNESVKEIAFSVRP